MVLPSVFSLMHKVILIDSRFINGILPHFKIFNLKNVIHLLLHIEKNNTEESLRLAQIGFLKETHILNLN